jgi:hypothetical protein
MKWRTFFVIRAKTVRGKKACEAPSVGRVRAGICGLSTFRNQEVFSW